jgi:hypothetical protein
MNRKRDRKKLKDTKIGVWLKDKAPEVLNLVGDLLPDEGALGIVKNMIDRDSEITPEVKAEAYDIIEMTKLEIEKEKEITARWQADMTSDSWLSKNVRPMVLLYSWFLVTVICVMRFFGVELPPPYVFLIETLCVSVNVAYFGSRTLEKVRAIKGAN